jgi:phosphopantothenoylcysteine decarboxylase/phosphopantothenate--cysteine ligase
MTASACEFVTPLSLQTLSGAPVTLNMFDPADEITVSHIALADKADVLIVAPATANIIAKAAAGIADDTASAIMLACKAPIVIAPAMNVNMWNNAATKRNVEALQERGVHFVGPEAGDLACGYQGQGRLCEVERIVDFTESVLCPKDMLGTKVVIAAGPTREHIDPIRFVSNRSSGKMGFALARAARNRGARVTLITGPTYLTPPDGVKCLRVGSAQEMRDAVLAKVNEPITADAGEAALRKQFVFMAAAVTDHRPTEVSSRKVKKEKDKSYSLDMEPSPDILQELGSSRASIERNSKSRLVLVGFTAETGDEEELLRFAREKLERKNADLMVGNFAEDSFERDTNRVWLLERDGGQEEVATADKLFIAGRIIRAALPL